MLSNRVQKIKPSATLSLAARAAELKAKGKNIISLTVGEPDFDTPEHIKEAAIKAIKDGKTKYTPVDGTISLKKAVQEKFIRENNLTYDLSEIMVSVGAKQAIYNVCQSILNDNDEVIIPAPYWVSYPDMVLLAGGIPKFIDSSVEKSYKITAEQLENAITPKTKLLIINSPSNPSGMIYSESELKSLAAVLLKHSNILILTDDIYEHIQWSRESFKNMINVCPELKDRTVVINGVSKSYAMTGWRIGYAAGNAKIIGAMKKIQSQSTSNPCSIAQYAAEAALKSGTDCIQPMVTEFKKRHDFLYNALKEINGIKIIPADGTFYAFPNVENLIKRFSHVKNDADFSEMLLNEAEIAVVPGTEFGCHGTIRLSYAVDMETLKQAVARIKAIC